MGKALCIFHNNCKDGVTAAWIVRKALGEENVEFYPGVYQQDPPDVKGRDVIFVDFAYKYPVMFDICFKARSVLVLDHHVTAEEDLKKLGAGARTALVFDKERSGATIAWDYYFSRQARPLFVSLVEDRDLWRKQLYGNEEFSVALSSYPQDFETWDRLVDKPFALIDEGRPILRYYRQQVKAIKAQAYDATIAGVPCRVANVPYNFASEVAGEIVTGDARFGACFFQRADLLWQYSLRSEGDFSVAEIAKQFGGGGHQHAAGFSSEKVEHQAR